MNAFDLFLSWLEDQYNNTKRGLSNTFNTVKNWARKKAVRPVVTIVRNIKDDLLNFNTNNTDEKKVLASHYFSAYKKKLVVRLPIGTNAFSFGILFLGNEVDKRSDSMTTVQHEYGHTQQFEQLGMGKYLTSVAIPSVTAYHLDAAGKLPYSYFTAPWESEADAHGGVNPDTRNNVIPWSEDIGYYHFQDLLRSLFYEILP